jgi:AcrR family transcriptional regulator
MTTATQRRAAPAKGTAADPSVRERLLGAAASIFARKGYAATSVGEIVAAAAVTKPVLYYWFSSKEGIYQALLEEAFASFEGLLVEAVSAPGGARERLALLCGRALEMMKTHLDIIRIMHAAYYGPPQGAPRFDFDVFHTRFREATRRIVEAGVRAGELRRGDAEGQTWAVVGALNICIELQLCHPELAADPRELFDRILDVIMRGVAAPHPKERSA